MVFALYCFAAYWGKGKPVESVSACLKQNECFGYGTIQSVQRLLDIGEGECCHSFTSGHSLLYILSYVRSVTA